MQSLHQTLEKYSKRPYDEKAVLKCLMLLKKSSSQSERQVQDLMFELFCLTSAMTIKAINNFFKLMTQKGVPKSKLLHDEEDIASECYFFLNRCVVNLKWADNKKFVFYINSAFNRMTYRLYERNYQKHASIIPNTDDNEYRLDNEIGYDHHFDLLEIDLMSLSLTPVENKILVMKIEGQNFQQFLKENKISHIAYKTHLESIREKINTHYGTNRQPIS